MKNMYDVVRVGLTSEDHRKNASFLAEIFNNPELFTEDYIKWQYADHPLGPIIGNNVMIDAQIAAHFVLQPFPALINGIKRKGLLAFNSATKKEYQGRGLFMTLANKTIDEALANGHEFIVAVTNHNSVHGYTKRLGFQLVCQLDAKIGLGKIDFNESQDQVVFEKIWNEELLNWRLANPLNKYSFVKHNQTGYYSKTHLPFVKAFLSKAGADNPKQLKDFSWRPSTLYIGLNPGVKFRGLFFDIPEKLKPSPLFLVYKDLVNIEHKLDKEKVKFNLIDFDAY